VRHVRRARMRGLHVRRVTAEAGGTITEIDILSDPERLSQLDRTALGA